MPESPASARPAQSARVREALGLSKVDAAWLRQILLKGARTGEAIQIAVDAFGIRWRVDVAVERQGKKAVVRSMWIIRGGEDSPRFVTCWVL